MSNAGRGQRRPTGSLCGVRAGERIGGPDTAERVQQRRRIHHRLRRRRRRGQRRSLPGGVAHLDGLPGSRVGGVRSAGAGARAATLDIPKCRRMARRMLSVTRYAIQPVVAGRWPTTGGSGEQQSRATSIDGSICSPERPCVSLGRHANTFRPACRDGSRVRTHLPDIVHQGTDRAVESGVGNIAGRLWIDHAQQPHGADVRARDDWRSGGPNQARQHVQPGPGDVRKGCTSGNRL